MRINQEEIVRPVAAVILVRDYEEALAVANATPFALSAGIDHVVEVRESPADSHHEPLSEWHLKYHVPPRRPKEIELRPGRNRAGMPRISTPS
jgi:hypothetical protein